MTRSPLHDEVRSRLHGLVPGSWRGPDAPTLLEPMRMRATAARERGDERACFEILVAISDVLSTGYDRYEGECEIAEFLDYEVAPALATIMDGDSIPDGEKRAVRTRLARYDEQLLEGYGIAPFEAVRRGDRDADAAGTQGPSDPAGNGT